MFPELFLLICAHAHNKCSTVNGRGEVKPIYKDLTRDADLSKCLRGLT